MNARMANHNDIDKLIRVRFDYFATEKWEVTDEIRVIVLYSGVNSPW